MSGGFAVSSISAGSPETMSFGRPVLPPDVGAFHACDVTYGRCDASRSGARKPVGKHVRPATEPSDIPIIADGLANSMMASNSRCGSRDEIGCGVAPNRQIATYAIKKSRLFGTATVTMSPSFTPASERYTARL